MSRYSVVGTTLTDRRRNRRTVMPPVHVEIDGVEYATVDWSLGGFRLSDYTGDRAPGDVVPITIIATVSGALRRHQVTAEIMRLHLDQDTELPGLAGAFEAIDPATIETLEAVIMERFTKIRQ